MLYRQELADLHRMRIRLIIVSPSNTRMNRQFFFRHYWWIALLAAFLGVGIVLEFATTDRTPLVGSVIAGVLAFSYFAQAQKLAEMSLFKQLFTEFNQRYDIMNDRLVKIARSPEPPDEGIRQAIVAYINLCAEEYLWFSEGYIHREVWRSWCVGMLWYLDREPFRTVWVEESATNSCYGLSLEIIRRGAG